MARVRDSFNFIDDQSEWVATTIDISRVRVFRRLFEAWSGYINGSLRRLIMMPRGRR